jgi:uracil phosphoribosyltransferase
MENIHVLKSTIQIRGLHTIIRDENCSRQDFIFYSDRLIRLLIEGSLNFLPYEEVTVTTPTKCTYNGVKWTGKICCVPILRSGEAMENVLRDVCKDVRVGKILIQRNEDDASAVLYYHKLPSDIADRYVLLLDPMLATGNSICCAIKLLIEE